MEAYESAKKCWPVICYECVEDTGGSSPANTSRLPIVQSISNTLQVAILSNSCRSSWSKKQSWRRQNFKFVFCNSFGKLKDSQKYRTEMEKLGIVRGVKIMLFQTHLNLSTHRVFLHLFAFTISRLLTSNIFNHIHKSQEIHRSLISQISNDKCVNSTSVSGTVVHNSVERFVLS
jgi:hypothetical protein